MEEEEIVDRDEALKIYAEMEEGEISERDDDVSHSWSFSLL